MFRSEMPPGNPESSVVSRRWLLRSTGWAAIGASAAALLAACGDPELPKPPAASGRAAASQSQPVTPVVAVNEREATPQPGAPITLGVPTGNPLFDQVSLRVTGLAADATRTAEAPGDLSVVQFEQALSFNAADIATAVEALLASHPQLDAVLLLNADLALLLAANLLRSGIGNSGTQATRYGGSSRNRIARFYRATNCRLSRC